jgi:heptosyltransferase III
MQRDAERVLIYRLGSMGDTVISLPAFHLIERAFPNADRRLLTNVPINEKAAAAAAILEGSGLIHGYFHYPVGTRDVKVLLGLWWKIVRWRPQMVVYLGSARGTASAKRDAWFFRMCGIGRQIGIPLTDDMQRNRWLTERRCEEFECERLVRNIAELGDGQVYSDDAWDLRLTGAERAKADEVLAPAAGRPVLAISLGTKVTANNWGRDKWRRLLARLGRLYPEYVLVFTGVTGDSEASEYVADGWRETAGPEAMIINLCGKLTPRESSACFAKARIFVGHDSGPMHLADAVGTQSVAIFSARNPPQRWFPHRANHRVVYHKVHCHGCGMRECLVEKMKCVTSITVDEVFDEICGALDGKPAVNPALWLETYEVIATPRIEEGAHAS